MSKLTDSEKLSLITLGKQFQYEFKKGHPDYQKIEFHVRRCLARGQEPIEIQPPVVKRETDTDYYRYLSKKCKKYGYKTGVRGRFSMENMKAFLDENDIPYLLKFMFMRRDYRTYRECTTPYQQLLFRARARGYQKITKGRPSLKSLNEFLAQF